ncbi:SPFH domain-containing protein, partial [Candidatus Poribacteria bacterium]|nr:SPFH domain-containing protein [Candidatus Poribacteria bacterium]
MSLFNFLRTELIDIIEWNEEARSDVMAWRFPRHDNEIKNGAKLIVREGQTAVLVNMGKLADVYPPGMYTLETKNMPLLSTLLGWKYGFDSPFKCEVYFLSTRRFLDQKWGTANPITMRDAEFGMVRVRAFGSYAIQVSSAEAFLREVLASAPQLESYQISGQLRNLIVTRFSDALASSGTPVLDVAANLDELSRFSQERLQADFAPMGIAVPIFLVENVSLPENVEKALDKRTSMSIVGDLNAYAKYQAANALEQAAVNPAEGGAGLGMGLGAGMAMAQQMMSTMNQSAIPQNAGSCAGPPPLPSNIKFYVGINGQQVGPYEIPMLRQQITTGRIRRDTLVWRDGMPGWAAAGQVVELAGLFGSVPPPLPPA